MTCEVKRKLSLENGALRSLPGALRATGLADQQLGCGLPKGFILRRVVERFGIAPPISRVTFSISSVVSASCGVGIAIVGCL